MKKSFFENISDKVLFVFLKSLKKELGNNPHKISVADFGFNESIENLSEVFGYPKIETLDVDYIGEIYKLNYKLLEEPKLENPLKRPELERYSVDFNEFRTDYVRYIYRVPISTYSGINNVSEVALIMQTEDEVDIYDDLIEHETIDSDYTDMKIDKTSITKID